MTEEEIDDLEAAKKAFADAVARRDMMLMAETDEMYHETIYKGTKNNRLIQIINNLREQMYRYRLEYIKDADKHPILLIEHDNIFKAVRARHVAEAKAAMREHIDNQEITVSKNLKEKE